MRGGILLAVVVACPASGARSDFDVEWERLRRGRPYAGAETGTITYRSAGLDGSSFETFVDIPESYDPARRWPARVQLHGGVSRPPDARRPRAYGAAELRVDVK